MDRGGLARATAAARGGGTFLRRRLAGAELRAVPEVRHALRALLHGWGTGDLRDSAELLTCELVTNALVHSGDDAEITATVGPRGLHVEVRDFHAGAPRMSDTDRRGGQDRAPESEDDPGTSGRGLFLVQSLADAWGIRAHAVGKSVWFDLAPAPGS